MQLISQVIYICNGDGIGTGLVIGFPNTFYMETNFQISLHIKTQNGFKTYGSFDLGLDREQATAIVEQFKGTDDLSENSILYMDFTEVRNGIPFPVRILHCTLDDIAYNTRIITRDVFKNISL